MREHGSFDLNRHGSVILLRAFGGSNIESFRTYSRNIQELGQQQQGNPWATLVDTRSWGLSGMDIQEPLRELAGKLDKLGRTHSAMITGDNEQLVKYLLQLPISGNSSVKVEFFNDVYSAVDWLEDQEFDCAALRDADTTTG